MEMSCAATATRATQRDELRTMAWPRSAAKDQGSAATVCESIAVCALRGGEVVVSSLQRAIQTTVFAAATA